MYPREREGICTFNWGYKLSHPIKGKQAALTATISLGGEEKRKDTKTWKSRSEEKGVGFSLASLFPARKWEAVTQGGTI